MALSLQSANLVRQKAYNAVNGANPQAYQALKAFFRYWSVSQANADLQFVPFAEADADDADGTGLLDAACKVHVFYTKKLAAATANTVKLFNHATADTSATDQTLSLPLDAASQEAWQIYPTGFSHDTGVTVTQHTTIEGSSDGSDGGNGFIIVSAA